MPLWLKIVICVIGVEVLGASSGIVGAGSSREWYDALQDPPGTPPGWVFGPVWTVLYALIGTSLALVWHRGEPRPLKMGAVTWWFVQMALNVLWTPLFFGAQDIQAALLVIVVLFIAILVTMRRFRRLDRLAAGLLVPYLCWVGYATYLNAGYFVLNR